MGEGKQTQLTSAVITTALGSSQAQIYRCIGGFRTYLLEVLAVLLQVCLDRLSVRHILCDGPLGAGLPQRKGAVIVLAVQLQQGHLQGGKDRGVASWLPSLQYEIATPMALSLYSRYSSSRATCEEGDGGE